MYEMMMLWAVRTRDVISVQLKVKPVRGQCQTIKACDNAPKSSCQHSHLPRDYRKGKFCRNSPSDPMKCQDKVCGMKGEGRPEFSAMLITGRGVALCPLMLWERREDLACSSSENWVALKENFDKIRFKVS